MKPSRYDDHDRYPPMAWWEWMALGVAGLFFAVGAAFAGGALWLSWKAVFG